MRSVEQIVQSVKELEERFLEKEVDTGDPADDVDTGPLGDGDTYNELEAFTTLVSNSAINCMVGIEQMLRGHKAELSKKFGDEAEGILKQAQDVLQGIADLFEDEEPEDEPEEDEDENEEDEPEDEPENEPKDEPEEEPKEPKEEPK